MRQRNVLVAASAAVLLVAGLAAGCGSQGVATPTPQTVVGTVPKNTTPTTKPGDPVAGKAVFAANGCQGCHTYTPAGSTATQGPNLDKLPEYAKKAGQPLEAFTLAAITSPPAAYVPPGYQNIMPTNFGATIKPQALADLVAFLTKP